MDIPPYTEDLLREEETEKADDHKFAYRCDEYTRAIHAYYTTPEHHYMSTARSTEIFYLLIIPRACVCPLF